MCLCHRWWYFIIHRKLTERKNSLRSQSKGIYLELPIYKYICRNTGNVGLIFITY